MSNKTPSYLYNPELCPCPKGEKTNCPRFRDCEACIANHRVEGNPQQTACEKKATLIVYYTLEGNTDFVAKKIAKAMGYETLRLKPEKRYPRKGFLKFMVGGFDAVREKAPELKPYEFNAENYARVVFGFPVWAGNVTPPIRSFAKENDLSGMKIAAFACQGGSGAEKAFVKLKEALGIGALEAELILNDPKSKPSKEDDRQIQEFCAKLKDGLR